MKKKYHNNIVVAGMGPLFSKRESEKKVAPGDAACVTCLGYGTVFQTQGADNGRRQRVTVTCPDCNGKKLRAIPMVELQ